MTNSNVSLDDKYSIESGRIFVTGVQALARIPMVQRQRDVLEGLNTAGFISGYCGSPVGGFDQQLWRAKKFLEQNHIRFQPGLNEDLAASAIWEASRLICTKVESMTVSSPSGMVRGQASIDAVTFLNMAICQARQSTAACCS